MAKLRMDEAGPRLARIVKELRILQGQLHNKRLGELIEELASAATAALGWEWLAEANGFSRREIILEFVKQVNELAEQNIEKTGKLEGAHYAAMQTLVQKLH